MNELEKALLQNDTYLEIYLSDCSVEQFRCDIEGIKSKVLACTVNENIKKELQDIVDKI